MKIETVLMRVDGSLELGMGHIMRCIALAQEFQLRGKEVVFILKNLLGKARSIVHGYGFRVVLLKPDLDFNQDSIATIGFANFFQAKHIIVDLNNVDTLPQKNLFINFLRNLKNADLIVIVIEGMDDECISMRKPIPASAVVIPYLGAQNLKYKALSGTKILAGEKYFPFRLEFKQSIKQKKKINKEVKHILITIGGGNVSNYNKKICLALQELDNKNLLIRITGELNLHSKCPSNVKVLGNVSNINELVCWADLAIIGSGLTRYETALMATPTIVFSLNQAHMQMVEKFVKKKTACHGGLLDDLSVEQVKDILRKLINDVPLRRSMSKEGALLIDGKGSARLVNEIFSLKIR